MEYLNTIVADVQQELGFPPEDVLARDTIIRAINKSYFAVLRRFRHDELRTRDTVTTIDGTSTYTLPSNFWYADIVKDTTNDQILRKKTLSWVLEQDQDDEGEPLWWAREYKDHFILNPVPDDAYTITFWFYTRPVALVQPLDQTILEDEWDEVVELGAAYRCFALLGEYDRQIHYFNMYRHEIKSMTEEETLDEAGGLDIVGPLEDFDEHSN